MPATLGEDSLNVAEATITAHFNCQELVHVDGRWHSYDDLMWDLDIYTELSWEFEYEGQMYVDSMTFNFAIHTFRIPQHPQRWADLVGQTIKWEGMGQTEGELTLPEPMMYWEGEYEAYISKSTLSFLDCNEHSFRILWEGTTDEPRVFSIDTWVRFSGVAIYRDPSDTRTMEEILAHYFNPDDFMVSSFAPAMWFPPQHKIFFEPRI